MPATPNPTEDPFDRLTFSQMKQCVVAYHGLKTDHDCVNAGLRETIDAKGQLEKENIMLKKDNATLKKGKAALLERVESADQENVVRIKTVAELRTSLEMAKSEIGRLKERNATLQRQLDDAASAEDDRTTYLRKIEDLERSLAGKDSLLSSQQAEHKRARREFSEHMEKLEAEREDLACQALRRSSEESHCLAAWLELTDSRDVAEHNSYQLALALAKASDEHLTIQAALTRLSEQIVAAERQAAHYKLEVCVKSKALKEITGEVQWLSDAYESNRADLNDELSRNRELNKDLRDCRDRADREKKDRDSKISRLDEDAQHRQQLIEQKRNAYEKLRSHCNKLQQELATRSTLETYLAETAAETDTKKRKRTPVNGFRACGAHLVTKDQLSYDHSKKPGADEDIRSVSIHGRILPRGVTMLVDKTKMHEIVEVDEHITEGGAQVVDADGIQHLNEMPWTLTAHDQRPWVMDPEKGLVDPSTVAMATSTSAHEQSLGGLDTPASPDELAGGKLSITVPSIGTKNAELQTPASPVIDSALDPITRAEASPNATAENTLNAVWRQWDDEKQDMDGDSLRRLRRQELRRNKLQKIDRYVPEERDGSLFVSPTASRGGRMPASGEVFDATLSHEPAMHPNRAAPVAPKEILQSGDEHAGREQPAPQRRPSSTTIPAAYHEDLCQPQAPSRLHNKLPKRAWPDGPSNPRAVAASKRRRRRWS
ncbi:hypothetical protein EJ03DRAFT_381143 [Teratosphaeria nubilosa]|uniref:Uncharacterized protein n=1 Tax=Teratosphaeria nubilosa TaxID=161662 RepID=A0A6G1LGB8_9PEZI|nr:hypothetical protein EJ03DRAFT_381143 [Teratosphaeria nubilosa]